MIDISENINDIRIPKSNHLEKLTGDLIGLYSIRVNNQYRIVFRYLEGDCYDLELLDYH